MKKTFLLILILISAVCAFAQDNIVREGTEWTIYYRYNCNDYSKPHVLMIGDSICNGYRDALSVKLQDEFQVDKLATSRSLDQKLYFDQLNMALSEVKYDIIIFNFGLHGFHINGDDYYKGMDKLAKVLKAACPKVYCLETTPLYYENEKDLIENNKIVVERNSIAKKIADKNKIGLIKWYDMWYNKPQFRSSDPYHYNEQGQNLQGEFLAGQIIEIYNK